MWPSWPYHNHGFLPHKSNRGLFPQSSVAFLETPFLWPSWPHHNHGFFMHKSDCSLCLRSSAALGTPFSRPSWTLLHGRTSLTAASCPHSSAAHGHILWQNMPHHGHLGLFSQGALPPIQSSQLIVTLINLSWLWAYTLCSTPKIKGFPFLTRIQPSGILFPFLPALHHDANDAKYGSDDKFLILS